MFQKSEVAILGAGPSGAITALFLAKQGISSVVLEKEVFPRYKACADNILGNSLRILNEIDPTYLNQLSKEKLSKPILGIRAYTPNNYFIDIDFLPLEKGTDEFSCFSISRTDFDNFLMDRLKENPLVTVIENFNVKSVSKLESGILISSTNETQPTIGASMVACCAGSNSGISDMLLPQKKSATDYAVGVRAYFEGVGNGPKEQFCELAITPELMPGGIYLSPLANGQVNVNIVMLSDVVKKKKLDLKALLQKMITEHPALKDRFVNAKMIGAPVGSRLFLGVKKRRMSGDNFVLVGDAAGLIDLLSANGIPQAMLSARIAAEEIARCVKEQNFSAKNLAIYDKRVNARVASYLKLGRILAPFISNRIVLKLMLVAMNFVAKKSSKNEELRDLLYVKDVTKKLIKPSFYYRLFFGIKNSEHLA